MGAVLNNQMIVQLGKNLPADAASTLPTKDATNLEQLLLMPHTSIPAPIIDATRLSLRNSMSYLFIIAGAIKASMNHTGFSLST